jgi:hypothetical protein
MPVLIMVGKYDGAVGVDQIRDLADHLAHGRFDEFDQALISLMLKSLTNSKKIWRIFSQVRYRRNVKARRYPFR